MLMGFEEIDGDDDFQEEFACPFCAESYDIIGLCCHIDDEHTLESKNAVLLSLSRYIFLHCNTLTLVLVLTIISTWNSKVCY